MLDELLPVLEGDEAGELLFDCVTLFVSIELLEDELFGVDGAEFRDELVLLIDVSDGIGAVELLLEIELSVEGEVEEFIPL